MSELGQVTSKCWGHVGCGPIWSSLGQRICILWSGVYYTTNIYLPRTVLRDLGWVEAPHFVMGLKVLCDCLIEPMVCGPWFYSNVVYIKRCNAFSKIMIDSMDTRDHSFCFSLCFGL